MAAVVHTGTPTNSLHIHGALHAIIYGGLITCDMYSRTLLGASVQHMTCLVFFKYIEYFASISSAQPATSFTLHLRFPLV